MKDEVVSKRFNKVMRQAIMSYIPGSTVIHDTAYNVIKNYYENVSFDLWLRVPIISTS